MTFTGQAVLDIAAPPAAVWALLTDVERMGDWSPECRACDWLPGHDRAVVGARFRGRNRLGPIRWSATCEIDVFDEPVRFGFVARVPALRAATRWRFDLDDLGDGRTRVVESFRRSAVLKCERAGFRRPCT